MKHRLHQCGMNRHRQNLFLTQLFCQHERRNDGVLENSAKNRNSAHTNGRAASFARVPRARRFMSHELARGVSNGSRGLQPPSNSTGSEPLAIQHGPFRSHLQCRWKHHHGYSGTGCRVAGNGRTVTRANVARGARAIVDERLQARTTLEETRLAGKTRMSSEPAARNGRCGMIYGMTSRSFWRSISLSCRSSPDRGQAGPSRAT